MRVTGPRPGIRLRTAARQPRLSEEVLFERASEPPREPKKPFGYTGYKNAGHLLRFGYPAFMLFAGGAALSGMLTLAYLESVPLRMVDLVIGTALLSGVGAAARLFLQSTTATQAQVSRYDSEHADYLEKARVFEQRKLIGPPEVEARVDVVQNEDFIQVGDVDLDVRA